MTAAYVSHCLARINADLDFLVESGNLDAGDARVIRSRLPSASSSSIGRTPSFSSSRAPSEAPALDRLSITPSPAALPARAVPPAPQPQSSLPSPTPAPAPAAVPIQKLPKKVLALWPYHSATPGDLEFEKGAIITITEEANEHWWQGVLEGKSGIFPTNHVRVIDPTDPLYGETAPAPPQYYQNGYNGDNKMQMQPYGQPGPVYQQPPPQQQIVQQEQPKKRFGGGMGNTLAHSGVAGVGFGAGAAVGSGVRRVSHRHHCGSVTHRSSTPSSRELASPTREAASRLSHVYFSEFVRSHSPIAFTSFLFSIQ